MRWSPHPVSIRHSAMGTTRPVHSVKACTDSGFKYSDSREQSSSADGRQFQNKQPPVAYGVVATFVVFSVVCARPAHEVFEMRVSGCSRSRERSHSFDGMAVLVGYNGEQYVELRFYEMRLQLFVGDERRYLMRQRKVGAGSCCFL